MEKHYTMRSEKEAISSAKLIHEKYNVPVKVIKTKIEQNKQSSYVVIPNPITFFSNSKNEEPLDMELRIKEVFGENKTVLSLF